MRRKKLGRSSRTSGSTIALIVLLFVGTVTLGGGIGYFYFQAQNVTKLDAQTLCPLSGPTGQLAILVDKTDPVTIRQLSFAQTKIEDLVEAAAAGTRISLGVISPDEAVVQQEYLSICKPPSANEANGLIQNIAAVDQAYKDGFKAPLDSMLRSLMVVSEAPSSPIMEDLQTFLSRIPDTASVGENKILVIFSNLAQHSGELSFYEGGNWTSFSSAGGDQRLARSLSGFEVKLMQIPILEGFQPELEDFWARYFDAQGASKIRYERVGDL
ncbi:hypothetical protein [Paragemmobacter straminiformis]|uniref:Uncharacterized protein n=1 Tax=Paragemmobacter straminiformis TaxID=2045119 RepID=A0A842I3R4_9RHOB|nr:hypothetical protein [Gemmobacter straminiformis]MBC2834083.1 hypothetical protein [Gemmobacter straminiformis]